MKKVYPIRQSKWSWIVICPYCNNEHVHGKKEGWRASDCLPGGEYYVQAP